VRQIGHGNGEIATPLRRLRYFPVNRHSGEAWSHQIVKFTHDPLAAALKEVNVAVTVRRVRTIRKLFT
jgi:hypothetical protein